MDIIFRVKQIRELEGFTRKERRKLFNKNRLNMYNHWQGWMGYLLFVSLIAFTISSNYWLPKEVTLQYRLLILIPISIIVLAIHRVCYLSTVAPYIRKDIELMRNEDIKSNDINISEQGHLQGPVDKTPPGL